MILYDSRNEETRMTVQQRTVRKPIVDRDALVARARALQPLLREQAAEADAQRSLTEQVHAALIDAGMFRLATPTHFGGYNADMRTLVEVIEELGVADASAAWLVAIGAGACSIVGGMSEEAQEEIFSSGPDVRIAGGFTPGIAERVDGGVRLTGRWSYASGSRYAQWAAISGALTDDSGEINDVVLGIAPASQVTVEDTWHTVGMRGTGSNTYVCEKVFVPTHRLISISSVIDNTGPLPSEEAIHRLPFAPLASVQIVAPLLGAGRASMEQVIEKAALKPVSQTRFARQVDSTAVRIQIANAALKVRTAQLLAYDCADRLDASTHGEPLDYLTRARLKAQAGRAAEQVLEAIQLLISIHGAGSFAEANRLQQIWRDANTAARHAALNPLVGCETYGVALLGVWDPITTMV
jgi:alkylation response protein AidB-like acyl-CoA dehydrogenase